MKQTTRSFLGVLCFAGSVLCLSDVKPFPRAKWTVAVYMNGDNELETSITGGNTTEAGQTINLPGDFHFELASPGSNSDVHVVALVDRSPLYSTNMDNWINTRLYYVQNGDYPDDAHGTFWTNGTNYDEFNMADPLTLTAFIRTVQQTFPADHFYFSMWDHNWGWHAGWFQKDETSDSDTMDYGHLYKAIVSDSNGMLPIDVVGYDACVASQIEVMHTWHTLGHTFVGSQDYVGWGGVDYSVVVKSLQEYPSMSPKDLTVVIADSMMTDSTDHCASSFDLRSPAFHDVVGNWSYLGKLFTANVDALRSRLIDIRAASPQTPHYPSDEFHRDLYAIAQAVSTQLTDYPDIVSTAQSVVSAFDRSLIYNNVSAAKHSSCKGGNGMSVYWTKSGKRPSKDYFLTSFALATQWDEFLQVF